MAEDMIVGPAGGCAQCYQDPCVCKQEAATRKRRKANPAEIETRQCRHCQEWAVVPDIVRQEFICLRCGQVAVGYSSQRAALPVAREPQGETPKRHPAILEPGDSTARDRAAVVAWLDEKIAEIEAMPEYQRYRELDTLNWLTAERQILGEERSG